jgi:hypothetical protein
MSKDVNKLTVDKCMEQVDMIDYYITKNILKIILNKANFEFVKNNIFLLGINNKNNKNSLIILLEGGKYKQVKKLINHNFEILNFKNINENNLFKLLLGYDYFYDLILNSIKNLERSFIINIITYTNTLGNNFVDNLIVLLNSNYIYYYKDSNDINDSNDSNNKKILLKKLIDISHNIYSLDAEKHTLIITKLCKIISGQIFLIDILKYFDIDNFDVYPDSNMYLCVDYLVLNEYFEVLLYLLDKINYIEFTNVDDNIIFKLCENLNINDKIKSDIIIKILYKSNIAKFKNNKNQNIFYWLISKYNIDTKIIMNFIDYINIYEQDIYGQTLFDLIENKYNKKNVDLIKKYFSEQMVDKNIFSQIYSKINIKDKLIKSDIGVFTSNIIHNMLYTLYILDSNKNLIKIPSFELGDKQISYFSELIEISNNEKSLTGYLKLFFINFTKFCPHLVVWKNKYNYWIDPNLLLSIQKNKSVNFLYIKLSVYLMNNVSVRHSNVIIVDNVNKIVERFEPYGEMIFSNSVDINNMIQVRIATPLGYKFVFSQPYPGFQSRSDEFAKYNKNYGDPMGYCLAWSFLYIDIKMELLKNKINVNPIDFINWYIINKFDKDFNIDYDINKTNKYILFIRFYAKYLDLKKNEIIEKFGLEPSLSYQNDLDSKYQDKLIQSINKHLELFC